MNVNFNKWGMQMIPFDKRDGHIWVDGFSRNGMNHSPYLKPWFTLRKLRL